MNTQYKVLYSSNHKGLTSSINDYANNGWKVCEESLAISDGQMCILICLPIKKEHERDYDE
tara:strand:- start:197 stop:379 length:183 start_codon:yes stop_codon:yes gene_type:complete